MVNICSTRVSNELGGGNSEAAKVAVFAVMLLAVVEIVIVSSTLFICRHVLGYAFSNERKVVDHVGDMGPLISLSIIMDGLQAVLSGKSFSTFIIKHTVPLKILVLIYVLSSKL